MAFRFWITCDGTASTSRVILSDKWRPIERRFGCYPESVHVDQIYRTRANRAFCKAKGIRMSGPPLGRRPKDVSAATKKQARADESIRSTIEGKFGQAKRRFGLARVMAKLATTSAAQISLSFLVMNLEAAAPSASFCADRFAHTPAATPGQPLLIAQSVLATAIPAASPSSAPPPCRPIREFHPSPS